ncbi:hypothetical protein [Streptomyces nodosus]|uniref:Uncharacterized protein n=1 Tax=Streptomyces nodosus TaxID=40318 RepID=A0A5P2W4K4_9ACTN|nr:hypothetical protein [Streptomyces nodosus]MBB4792510.1 hypothetical protein [Streptomyces nodosus]QEV39882.1 hypothetical protein CP978_16125 [Streptomyces nodosus]
MASLLDDVRTSAARIARALGSSGYRADFTPESLPDIERFMSEHSDHGIATDGGLLATDRGPRLFALGAYLGETVRQGLGGVWEVDDQDPHGEINIVLRLPDGSIIWPVQRVIKRFQNGPEDSLVGYAIGLGLRLSAQSPARPHRRRSWFRRG